MNILSQLNHQNIVRYYGHSLKDDTFNIFIEFIAGGSIQSLVKKYGSLNERLIQIYTKQILKGLEYLHVNKIVHRDIKGGNILVDRNGVCKLADFGNAKRFSGEINPEQ